MATSASTSALASSISPVSPVSPIATSTDSPMRPLCSDVGVRCENGCGCGVCLNALRTPRCFEHSRQWTGRAKNGTYCDHELDPIAASSSCVSTGECNTNGRIGNCQAAQAAVLSAGFSVRAGGPNSRLALSVYKRYDCACPPQRHQRPPSSASSVSSPKLTPKPRRHTSTDTAERLPWILLLLMVAALTIALVAWVCGAACRARVGCAASTDASSPTLLQPLLPRRHEQPLGPPQLGSGAAARLQLQLNAQSQTQSRTQAVRAQTQAIRATCARHTTHATHATPMELQLERAGVVRQEPLGPLGPPRPPRPLPGRPALQREFAASCTTEQVSGVGRVGRVGGALTFRFH